MTGREDDEFWGNVGSHLEFKTLLHNALSLCDKNSVMIGEDVIHVDIHRACPNLRIKQVDQDDPAKAQIYCEECGIICPVVVPTHEALFGKREQQQQQADELDEFLDRAGSQVQDDDDDGTTGTWYGDEDGNGRDDEIDFDFDDD